MGVFGVFLLAAPLLALATAVVELWSLGPLGWLAAVLLVLAVGAGTWWSVRVTRRWWRGTRVAPRAQVRPADLRRAGLGATGTGVSGGGTGPATAARPGGPGGSSAA